MSQGFDPTADNGTSEKHGDDTESSQKVSGGGLNKPNKFNVLCDGVVNASALLHASLQEFLEFKDELLKHFLPPSVLLKFSLTSSKIFRSVTDLHEPVHELIRMVHEYSTPWEEKSAALRKMHDDFQKKKRQLDVAIKRLSLVDSTNKRALSDRKVLNWEKLYCKVTTAKSHGRRWKYTILNLKEKAKQGYEFLVNYVDHLNEGNEEYPDVADIKTDLPDSQIETGSDEAGESTFSRQDQSLGGKKSVFSELQTNDEAAVEAAAAASAGRAAQPPLPPPPPPKPATASSHVWTDEGQYETELRVRVYYPKGFAQKGLRCSFTYGSQFVRTQLLDELAKPAAGAAPPKPSEAQQKRAAARPAKKGQGPGGDKEMSKETEAQPERYEEISFHMKDKRIGLKLVAAKVDSMNIALHAGQDEDMIAMAMLEANDIENVEMPVVYQVKDQAGEAQASEADRRILSYDSKSALSATGGALPTQFPLFPVQGGKSDAERKPCGQLLLYFYYLKTLVPRAWERSAGTGSFRDVVFDETGIDIYEPPTEVVAPETADTGISPMPPSTPSVDKNVISMDEHHEVVAKHQKAATEMGEAYEWKIQQLLSQLEDMQQQLQSQQQMLPPFERNFSMPEKPRSPNPFVFQRKELAKKKLAINQRLPKWGEGLPADFFERMEQFKEESEEHRRILYEHVTQQIKEEYEKKLAFQFKASRHASEAPDTTKDVSLPALFMPFRGRNVYNPRARQYFHPPGTTGSRLTQPPSMMSLPPLKHQISLVNLFHLGNSMHNPSWLLQHYLESKAQSTIGPNITDQGEVVMADADITKAPPAAAAAELIRIDESDA